MEIDNAPKSSRLLSCSVCCALEAAVLADAYGFGGLVAVIMMVMVGGE